MTRTRSGKSLTEWLVIFAVLLGLSGMLARTVQKVHAVTDHGRAGAWRGPSR
jgi:hypothetical protein